MRISDWSSDVCSSDLVLEVLHEDGGDIEAGEIVDLGEGAGVAERVVDRDRPGRQLLQQLLRPARRQRVADRLEEGVAALGVAEGLDVEGHEEIGRASCRERVCQYV